MGTRVSVTVSSGTWFLLALMILLLPLPWLLALTVSSAVHELCHLTAVRITGAQITGFRIGAGGMYLETVPLPPLRRFVCSIAGPVGTLFLLLFARWMPRTALCAAVQSCYHLLPVFPLDGGRALESLCDYFGWDSRLCGYIEKVVFLLLLLFAVNLTAAGLRYLPFLAFFAVIFRIYREKFLAKRTATGYNRLDY